MIKQRGYYSHRIRIRIFIVPVQVYKDIKCCLTVHSNKWNNSCLIRAAWQNNVCTMATDSCLFLSGQLGKATCVLWPQAVVFFDQGSLAKQRVYYGHRQLSFFYQGSLAKQRVYYGHRQLSFFIRAAWQSNVCTMATDSCLRQVDSTTCVFSIAIDRCLF